MIQTFEKRTSLQLKLVLNFKESLHFQTNFDSNYQGWRLENLISRSTSPGKGNSCDNNSVNHLNAKNCGLISCCSNLIHSAVSFSFTMLYNLIIMFPAHRIQLNHKSLKCLWFPFELAQNNRFFSFTCIILNTLISTHSYNLSVQRKLWTFPMICTPRMTWLTYTTVGVI